MAIDSAKEQGYRARSAFKLLQLDEHYSIFKNVSKVVDLCAAPGSWSQVLNKNIKSSSTKEAKIVAVDLQPMFRIDNVIQLKGDITLEDTSNRILSYFQGELAEMVVCDGAPDVTGVHTLDTYNQSHLLLAAFNITSHILQRGGTYIAKVFVDDDISILVDQMRLFFDFVELHKPISSRSTSTESFIVCMGYNPSEGFVPSMTNPFVNTLVVENIKDANAKILPFLWTEVGHQFSNE